MVFMWAFAYGSKRHDVIDDTCSVRNDTDYQLQIHHPTDPGNLILAGQTLWLSCSIYAEEKFAIVNKNKSSNVSFNKESQDMLGWTEESNYTIVLPLTRNAPPDGLEIQVLVNELEVYRGHLQDMMFSIQLGTTVQYCTLSKLESYGFLIPFF